MTKPVVKTSVEIIGVYPIKAREPVHLVEMLIRHSKRAIKVGKITQELPGQPELNWQVAYDEKILNAAGTRVVAGGFLEWKNPGLWSKLWIGDVRLVFFFHYLDLSKPLKTPLGDASLPPETKKPRRLSAITYEPPC
jgi:hypothetical protein